MTPPAPADLENLPDAVVESDSDRKGLPIVWILPLVALLVGGWLLYKTFSETGPEVAITFRTAEGIEEGKTRIKYRDVNIGQVQKVRFSDDLKQVVVTAELVPGMQAHLSEATRFWVVRPRVGAGGISGLGTLLSGAYIAMDPGDGETSRLRDFTGMENPPAIAADEKGTLYHLKARNLGSVSVGSPVYFRQIVVGEVTEYDLVDDHGYVDVSVFVHAPHDGFVRTGTRFWEVGGVDVSLDASGINVEMESLLALVSGGVAFETTEAFNDSPRAAEGAQFPLYANRSESLEKPITRAFPYMLRFTDTVRGLKVGAEVEFRGIRIGTVTHIEARMDVESGQFLIPVYINVEPDRWLSSDAIDPGLSVETQHQQLNKRLEYLASQGLRGRLQTGSLLTGQLYVDFDMYPDAESASLGYGGKFPELPVIPGQLAGITKAINKLMARLDQVPLEETIANLNRLMVSTSALATTLESDVPAISKELKLTLEETRKTLNVAGETLTSIEASTAPDGEIGNALHKTLSEIRNAARSIRVMADYLERHPEALLKGKGISQ